MFCNSTEVGGGEGGGDWGAEKRNEKDLKGGKDNTIALSQVYLSFSDPKPVVLHAKPSWHICESTPKTNCYPNYEENP